MRLDARLRGHDDHSITWFNNEIAKELTWED